MASGQCEDNDWLQSSANVTSLSADRFILNKIVYRELYGTPENLEIVTYTKSDLIKNIIQLKKALDILMQEINKLSSSTFLRTTPSYNKLGDLHIYDNGRDMIYEPTVL